MRIVVTGATGFVGGALAKALVAQGAEVVALARPTSDRSRLAGTAVAWVTADVTDPASLDGVFDGADVVVHAAGMLGQAGVPDSAYDRLHVTGTQHVIDEAVKAGVQRILYVSSPGVLGPIDGAPATEAAPLAPSNAYERSKAAAEMMVQVYIKDGAPIVIVRPEFLYGPEDKHVLGLFGAVQKGLFFYINQGEAVCHPTYVDDAVAGMLAALEQGQDGETYHICGPRPVTFRELGEAIAAALDVRPPWLRLPRWLAMSGATVLEGVQRVSGWTPPLSRTGVEFFSDNRRFSWQKAHEQLGFTPQTDIDEGVARTVAWYQEQGWL